MVQTVNVRKDGNKIKLHFMFNEDLLDIMREHHGYFFRKEKAWVFPKSKETELYNELTSKGYNIHYLNSNGQTTLQKPVKKELKVNPWDDKNVFMVAGICKQCNQWSFCYKDGICGRCR